MGNLLYLIALLHNAYVLSSEQSTPTILSHHLTETHNQTVSTRPHNPIKLPPISIGAYATVRQILNMRRLPLDDLYKIPKQLPTEYNLFSSVDFIALQDTPLQENDAIIVKQPELGDSSMPHLSFGVIAPGNTMIRDEKNPDRVRYTLSTGSISIYSRYHYTGETPIIESYTKDVTIRDTEKK